MIRLTQKPRRNKFNAKRTKIDGYTFDSHAEAHYYLKLKALDKAGELQLLEVHPKFVLIPSYQHNGRKVASGHYEGDFLIQEKDGKRVVIDVKGVSTALFLFKAKLFRWMYSETHELRVVKGGRE